MADTENRSGVELRLAFLKSRAKKKQHVGIMQKLYLRKSAMAHIGPGAAYVPFIGDGDIAAKLYADDRAIYGADLDQSRLDIAQSRMPEAHLRRSDCDFWPFPGESLPEMAVADCDAYANPYMAVRAFRQNANLAQYFAVFGTDGMRRRMKFGHLKSLPNGAETSGNKLQCRQQYMTWWKIVLDWLTVEFSPHKIVKHYYYKRAGGTGMIYWAIVVERAS